MSGLGEVELLSLLSDDLDCHVSHSVAVNLEPFLDKVIASIALTAEFFDSEHQSIEPNDSGDHFLPVAEERIIEEFRCQSD